jgi:hypothetical protein
MNIINTDDDVASLSFSPPDRKRGRRLLALSARNCRWRTMASRPFTCAAGREPTVPTSDCSRCKADKGQELGRAVQRKTRLDEFTC